MKGSLEACRDSDQCSSEIHSPLPTFSTREIWISSTDGLACLKAPRVSRITGSLWIHVKGSRHMITAIDSLCKVKQHQILNSSIMQVRAHFTPPHSTETGTHQMWKYHEQCLLYVAL